MGSVEHTKRSARIAATKRRRSQARYDRMCGPVITGSVDDRERIAGKLVLESIQRGVGSL